MTALADTQKTDGQTGSRWWWASPSRQPSAPAIPWMAPATSAITPAPTVVATKPIPQPPTPVVNPTAVTIAPPTPAAPSTAVVPPNFTDPDAYSPYNKYILGAASVGAFSALMYTIRMRTKGKMAVPLQELMDSPAGRAANPKLAAYMFAGRAFGTATILVLTGTVGATMAVASIMGVNSLKEFSMRMQQITASYLPNLKRSNQEDDSKFDPDAYAFLKEVSEDAAREEREGEWKESAAHAIIGNRVRHEIGPFSKHGQN
ncbi:hypothetical protein PhCBS80983_g01011 [Powellomyces hirtus]|uniref:Transmembrane protein 242 n=1 Tax=Powellomyces hirtus TaxID=109895 RepID=A0A507EC47_9FUNG|nr:hypothetical protein PhCBS80983_g01011 [Powellomyces hirtus]